MGAAAIPLLIGGGLLQAGSQYQAGQTASRNATNVANQLESNANLANINAGQQQAAGIAKASEAKRQNRFLQSRILAMAAAGGGSTQSKNIADLLSRTAGEGEYAALNSLYEGNTRADQLRNEAIGLRNQAATTRFEGRQARSAGNIGAVTSILGAGAKGAFYSKYNNPMPTNNANNSFNSDFADTDYDLPAIY